MTEESSRTRTLSLFLPAAKYKPLRREEASNFRLPVALRNASLNNVALCYEFMPSSKVRAGKKTNTAADQVFCVAARAPRSLL